MQETKNYVSKLMLCGQQSPVGQVLVLLFFPWSVYIFFNLCSPCLPIHCCEVVINSRLEKKKEKNGKCIFWIDCSVAKGEKPA